MGYYIHIYIHIYGFVKNKTGSIQSIFSEIRSIMRRKADSPKVESLNYSTLKGFLKTGHSVIALFL